jgi:hypothetical protein
VVVVSQGHPIGVVTRDELLGGAPETTLLPPAARETGAGVRRAH